MYDYSSYADLLDSKSSKMSNLLEQKLTETFDEINYKLDRQFKYLLESSTGLKFNSNEEIINFVTENIVKTTSKEKGKLDWWQIKDTSCDYLFTTLDKVVIEQRSSSARMRSGDLEQQTLKPEKPYQITYKAYFI